MQTVTPGDWVQVVKDQALKWLRERFEIPDAEWLPGRPRTGNRCPIASVLTEAGYANVWVGHSLIRYDDPVRGTLRVRLPTRVQAFPSAFDSWQIPELIETEWLARFCPEAKYPLMARTTQE